MLAIQHILQTEPTRESNSGSTRIYICTYWTMKGKVCNLIIDEGNCENMVSTLMVDKLSFATQKHIQPYSLSWLTNGNEIAIDRKWLVEFFVREQFQEYVCCDVVLMDPSQILLCCLWQYDCCTYHYDHKNIYSFTKDMKCIILWDDGCLHQVWDHSALYCLLQDLKATLIGLALVVLESRK